MFVLFNFIVGFVLAIFDGLMGLRGMLILLFILASIIPSISVAVRRLHDTDRSGWWSFITLIPLIGMIVHLVFMCLDGTRGSNRFGEDPKAHLYAPQSAPAVTAPAQKAWVD